MSKTVKPKDECLRCPHQTKLRLTPEGKKFCEYCKTRAATLKAYTGKSFVFEEDWRMGIANLLETWGSKPFTCPTCGASKFKVDIETHDQQKVGLFTEPPIQRIVVICREGHRYYPDESMRSTSLKKGIENK